jgi:predicted metal-dependent hydrolase
MDRDAAKGAGPLKEGGKQLALFDEPAPAGAGLVRSVLLGGRAVALRFARRRRRSIGIRVGEDGLSVAAPLNAPWREIEGFLRAKERWILEKLDERAAAGTPVTIFGESGEHLPLFGREVVLVVSQGRKKIHPEKDSLRIVLPEPQRRGAVRKLLIEWLKSFTLEHYGARAAHYAARLDFAPPPVSITGARTRWGACTSDGRIRLTWRLALLAPELGDYVVAHEVAHLVELNHSERFWALVEWLYPHWREARERIERAALVLPRL